MTPHEGSRTKPTVRAQRRGFWALTRSTTHLGRKSAAPRRDVCLSFEEEQVLAFTKLDWGLDDDDRTLPRIAGHGRTA